MIFNKLKDGLKAVVLATLYFAVWIGVLTALKVLVLEEYRIGFRAWSIALVGALVLAKVVLLLAHVPLGSLTRGRPALVAVIVRLMLCGPGVLVALVLEKAFESRQEHGDFMSSLIVVFLHGEIHHVWANTICLTGALLGYNILSALRRHLGEGALNQIFHVTFAA